MYKEPGAGASSFIALVFHRSFLVYSIISVYVERSEMEGFGQSDSSYGNIASSQGLARTYLANPPPSPSKTNKDTSNLADESLGSRKRNLGRPEGI